MKLRAEYEYFFRDVKGRNVLTIQDIGKDCRSLTNDILNVVEDICSKRKVDPDDYMIVYRDSEGIWDGWDSRKEDFVPLRCTTWEAAVDKYILIQLQARKNTVSH